MPNGDEEQLYCFEPSGEACDECSSAAGIYPEQPEPPHEGCNCSIAPVEATTCENEIRELEIDEETWEEEGPLVITNCGGEATSAEVTIDPVAPIESWDEGVEEAATAQGWSNPGDISASVDIDMPADSVLEVSVTQTYYSAMFAGELWTVCRTEDEEGEPVTVETHVGSVGGGWIGPTDVSAGEATFERCGERDGGTGDDEFFQGDDEFPGGEAPV
jgi:hypothetical protein